MMLLAVAVQVNDDFAKLSLCYERFSGREINVVGVNDLCCAEV